MFSRSWWDDFPTLLRKWNYSSLCYRVAYPPFQPPTSPSGRFNSNHPLFYSLNVFWESCRFSLKSCYDPASNLRLPNPNVAQRTTTRPRIDDDDDDSAKWITDLVICDDFSNVIVRCFWNGQSLRPSFHPSPHLSISPSLPPWRQRRRWLWRWQWGWR